MTPCLLLEQQSLSGTVYTLWDVRQKMDFQHSQAVGRVKLARVVSGARTWAPSRVAYPYIQLLIGCQLHSFWTQPFSVRQEIWPLTVPKIYIFDFPHWRGFCLRFIDSWSYKTPTHSLSRLGEGTHWFSVEPLSFGQGISFHLWVPSTFQAGLTQGFTCMTSNHGTCKGKSYYSFLFSRSDLKRLKHPGSCC